jgi:putative tryptophan/tyrosine transport system substrate-binding protein
MHRRDFIKVVAGSAAVLPFTARAQERIRLVGFLNILAEDDPESRLRIAAFKKSLQELGWTDGSNVRIETRWAGGDIERLRKHAKELVALGPDVILTSGSVTVRPIQQATRTTPIVFVQAVDPVGSGYVESMSHPGGNTTGFTQFEYSLSGKWLELLKQIAPQVTRVAVIRDPVNGSGIAQFAVIQAFAPPLGVELIPIDARDVGEIDRSITVFARFGDGGLLPITVM